MSKHKYAEVLGIRKVHSLHNIFLLNEKGNIFTNLKLKKKIGGKRKQNTNTIHHT